MAIVQHPLAAANLGAFVEHWVFNSKLPDDGEQANWCVHYEYQYGFVILRVEQNNYKYETVTYDKEEVDNYNAILAQ